MAELNNLIQKDYFLLTDYAGSVLQQSLQSIREKFPFHEISLFDNPSNGAENSIMEIRFDKEHATLSCSFDADKRCNMAYLFPDDTELLPYFIQYFNEKYTYDYLKSRWVLGDCFLSVKYNKFVTCFMFYCKNYEVYL